MELLVFYKQLFFQLSLNGVWLCNELSLKWCLSVAYNIETLSLCYTRYILNSLNVYVYIYLCLIYVIYFSIIIFIFVMIKGVIPMIQTTFFWHVCEKFSLVMLLSFCLRGTILIQNATLSGHRLLRLLNHPSPPLLPGQPWHISKNTQ